MLSELDPGWFLDNPDCEATFILAPLEGVEAQIRIRGSQFPQTRNVRFSPQAILNCLGCNGSLIKRPDDFKPESASDPGDLLNYAFNWMWIDGLAFYDDGRYEPYTDQLCNEDTFVPAMKIVGWCSKENISAEETQLMVWGHGPAIVRINASPMRYFVGKYWTGACNGKPDTFVLLVGWTETHWIIKNYWGKDWGIDGFVHIPKHNDCSIGAYFVEPFF